MDLSFGLFAEFDAVKIVCIDPFFRIAAAAADVAMHFYSRKYRVAENDVVSRTIGADGAVYAHNVGCVALGAKICVFPIRTSGT